METLTNPEILNPIDQVRSLKGKPSYGFVNTREILNRFAEAGWEPVKQESVHTLKNKGFQRHMIRLQNPQFGNVALTKVNETLPQLVLVNSHDSTSSLRIMWGLYRLVCKNGLLVGQSVSDIRLPHSHNTVRQLPEAINHMMETFPKVLEQTKLLQQKQLSPAATQELVQAVYGVRLDGVARVTNVDYTLKTLRAEDAAEDAYTVMNKVQEIAIRGGINYEFERQNKDGSTSNVWTTTRGVRSIAAQLKINRFAYDKAMELVA